MSLQAYIGVHMSAWSYNNLIQAWEPILEPWNVILKADMNTGSLVRPNPCCLQERFCSASSCTRVYVIHHTQMLAQSTDCMHHKHMCPAKPGLAHEEQHVSGAAAAYAGITRCRPRGARQRPEHERADARHAGLRRGAIHVQGAAAVA